MTESETTKNTLCQLEEKMNREHWGDIQLFEEEDNRYSIAIEKAILLIKELEQYQAIGTVEELQEIGSVKQIKDTMVKLQTVIHKLTKYLREWESIGSMEEFKSYKNGDCMNDCEHYDNCSNYIYSKGYNKAVDYFAERLKYQSTFLKSMLNDKYGWVSEIEIDEIAEQMKGGAV